MRVKLREVLEDREGAGMETEYTKEQLLEQARNFELRKCSRLRKATLIDRIVECFCNEDMLRSRLTCLTKEPTDRFCVFEEIAEIFSKIDDEAFRIKQNKKDWKNRKIIIEFSRHTGIYPTAKFEFVIQKWYILFRFGSIIGEILETE